MDALMVQPRMTRARAAKVGANQEHSAASTKKSRTAQTTAVAAKAKASTLSTASSSSTTTTSKRKATSEDVEEEDSEPEMALAPTKMKTTRVTRGRAKKTGDVPEPAAAGPATRTTRIARVKKTAEPVFKEQPAHTVRTTRTTKAKVTQLEEPEQDMPVAKKTVRSRATSTAATKASTARAKKTVSFETPDQENMMPMAAKGKKAITGPTTTGLLGKPVRKAASSTTGRAIRTTRAALSADEKKAKPLPLSPKKVTQMLLRKDDHAESEDELAAPEKTPLKMMKSPMRAPKSLSKPPAPASDTAAKDTATDLVLSAPDVGGSVFLGSPAKRPVPSPFKGMGMDLPAKRSAAGLGSSDEQQSSARHFAASLMQSPAKRPVRTGLFTTDRCIAEPQSLSTKPFQASLMQTPAKRVVCAGTCIVEGHADEQRSSATPFETLTKQSPAKRPPASAVQSTTRNDDVDQTPGIAAIETSVFSSAAKRPFWTLSASKYKVASVAGSPTLGPSLLTGQSWVRSNEDKDERGELGAGLDTPECLSDVLSGRLLAVLPRHADPTLKDTSLSLSHTAAEDGQGEEANKHADASQDEGLMEDGEPMVLDEPDEEPEDVSVSGANSTKTLSESASSRFGLRSKDLDPQEDDDSASEDEPTTDGAVFGAMPAMSSAPSISQTPSGTARKRSGQSPNKKMRTDEKLGFTPLAAQLSAWTACPSPMTKTGRLTTTPAPQQLASPGKSLLDSDNTISGLPVDSAFCDEAMASSFELAQNESELVKGEEEALLVAEIDAPVFSDVSVTDEDLNLAAEAHEMSLMEPERVDELLHSQAQTDGDSETEASQIYGDENATPIDPNLLRHPGPLSTPLRPISMRCEFHTVSKVPLKPADDSTPRPRATCRRHSISRLPVNGSSSLWTPHKRPTSGLMRNATVISYSPEKRRAKTPEPINQGMADSNADEDEEDKGDSGRWARSKSAPPASPIDSEEGCFAISTPARSLCRDVDAAVLKGAVVYVDVHTTEGADANAIFVELLTQMGACCVKEWKWSQVKDASRSDSKIGITHVVYKDGSKRTLDKVRESNGVVQCVGVGWVLDCERENEWLDEAPYYIDTSLLPHGGARHRQSMEPQALTNMTGELVPTPMRPAHVNVGRECRTVPNTPANRRRASGLWMHTPEDTSSESNERSPEHGDAEDTGSAWGDILASVPKTPAPETIARFAAAVTPGLETGSDGFDSPDQAGHEEREQLLMRTCPPHVSGGPIELQELGAGVLAQDKDETVLMRLLRARRKSLQFAPKVASPLSKQWR